MVEFSASSARQFSPWSFKRGLNLEPNFFVSSLACLHVQKYVLSLKLSCWWFIKNYPAIIWHRSSHWPAYISYTCHLMVANVTSDQLFQYPAAPLLCNNNVLPFGRGFPLAVLSILKGICCKWSYHLWGWHLFLSGCMFTGSDMKTKDVFSVHVFWKESDV